MQHVFFMDCKNDPNITAARSDGWRPTEAAIHPTSEGMVFFRSHEADTGIDQFEYLKEIHATLGLQAAVIYVDQNYVTAESAFALAERIRALDPAIKIIACAGVLTAFDKIVEKPAKLPADIAPGFDLSVSFNTGSEIEYYSTTESRMVRAHVDVAIRHPCIDAVTTTQDVPMVQFLKGVLGIDAAYQQPVSSDDVINAIHRRNPKLDITHQARFDCDDI